MAGHKGVDARLRRPMPGHDGLPQLRTDPMADKPRFYITTAIAYPNGPPHIGHAYEVIATDAIARFKRLDGYDVYLPHRHRRARHQDVADRQPRRHHAARARRPQRAALPGDGERLNGSNDEFIRTTEARHHASSQAIWQRMQDARRHLLSKYAGWYSVRDEAYYDESETKLARGRRASWSARHAGRMGGGGELFLPPLGLRTGCSSFTPTSPSSCCRRSG